MASWMDGVQPGDRFYYGKDMSWRILRVERLTATQVVCTWRGCTPFRFMRSSGREVGMSAYYSGPVAHQDTPEMREHYAAAASTHELRQLLERAGAATRSKPYDRPMAATPEEFEELISAAKGLCSKLEALKQ